MAKVSRRLPPQSLRRPVFAARGQRHSTAAAVAVSEDQQLDPTARCKTDPRERRDVHAGLHA